LEKVLWAFYLLLPGLLGALFLFLKDKHSGWPYLISEANIADDMTPRVNRYITDDSSVRVVGGDCRYLAHKEKWEENLRKWLGRGCRIDYLVSQPDDGAHAVLKKLQLDYPEKFQFRDVVIPDNASSTEDKELLEELQTFHFVLFDHPRQMWIEGNHPPKSFQAFDCEYVPPKRARIDARHDEYRSVFSDVWERLAKPAVEMAGS